VSCKAPINKIIIMYRQQKWIEATYSIESCLDKVTYWDTFVTIN